MKEIALPRSILSAVAAETVRFWLRRNLLAFALIGVATAVTTIFAFAGQIEHAPQFLGAVMLYAPVILGLLCMSGIVSDERASGLIVMWFQKPGSLFRAYLTRYLLNQFMLLAGTIVLASLVILVAISAGGFQTTSPFRLALGMLFLATLPAAVVFALSAFGVRRDSLVALSVMFLSFMFSAMLARSESLLASLVRAVAFPVDPFEALIFATAAYPPGIARPLAIIVAHIAGWTCIGLLGLQFTERSLKKGN